MGKRIVTERGGRAEGRRRRRRRRRKKGGTKEDPTSTSHTEAIQSTEKNIYGNISMSVWDTSSIQSKSLLQRKNTAWKFWSGVQKKF